jgi:hypothetical protein
MKLRKGHLDYWLEQGMEGRGVLSFNDDSFNKVTDGREYYTYDGMFHLKPGMFVRVYSKDGNDLLYEGPFPLDLREYEEHGYWWENPLWNRYWRTWFLEGHPAELDETNILPIPEHLRTPPVTYNVRLKWHNDRKEDVRIFFGDLNNLIAVVSPMEMVTLDLPIPEGCVPLIKEWPYPTILIGAVKND